MHHESERKSWPFGTGEMARCIRDYDWTTSPLGPIERWPESLKTTIQLALDSGFPSFVWWGPERIQIHNDAAVAILGNDHNRSLGHPAREVWSATWTDMRPLFDHVAESGEPILGENLGMRPRGGESQDGAHFTFCYSAVRDASGSVSGIQAIAVENTEHIKAIAALRESEERYRAIVEQARDYAIFSTDADRLVETWPPGAEAVYGWSPDEILGQPIDITFTPEDRAEGAPEWEASTARREGAAPNVRWHVRVNGQPVFIDGVSRARFDSDGTFLGLLKIGKDVTEERLAEQRRREEEERTRQQLEERVAAATKELRELSRRLMTVQEEERRHLARELHDEIGQMLTGLGLQLGVGRVLDERQMTDARRIIVDLTEQVRQLSMDLRPAALDAYGLLPALRWHLERFQTQTGIIVDLQHEGLNRRFDDTVEIAAYRIVQEALTNVARHAGTDEAVVRLLADDAMLTVSVSDRGRGFDPARIVAGTGLGGMRERAELMGGTWTVDATPGGGVTITAEIPIHQMEVER